jgi:hypothetical protein
VFFKNSKTLFFCGTGNSNLSKTQSKTFSDFSQDNLKVKLLLRLFRMFPFFFRKRNLAKTLLGRSKKELQELRTQEMIGLFTDDLQSSSF